MWKLFKKLVCDHREHKKKKVVFREKRQESMGESNKMVKLQDIVQAKQVSLEKKTQLQFN